MPDAVLPALALAAALGAGIVGGIFYAFSSFVMAALARIPAEQGVAAMNAINIVVIHPSFMIPFMGTAVAAGALVVGGLAWAGGASGLLLAAGGLAYLAGSLVPTMVGNQPMNLRLAALPAGEALAWWPEYVRRWTRWNTARTAASLAASALWVAGVLAG